MRCSKCGRENRSGRKFCAHCGVALTLVCPSCKAKNEPGERFCGECGHALAGETPSETTSSSPLASRENLRESVLGETTVSDELSIPDGERRNITVLFADIKGSMELMEGLDPEEARQIVDPALRIMMNAVHRYGGHVAQSTGDGIFALFGAPIAHEDHPQRGVYAALRMQEEIKAYANKLRIE